MRLGMAIASPTMVVLSASEMPRAMACGSLCGGTLAEGGEDFHQSRDRAEQPEQRSDADDHLQHEEAAFQPHDFVPRARLHRLHVFGFGPVQMVAEPVEAMRPSAEGSLRSSRVSRATPSGSSCPSTSISFSISGGTTSRRRRASAADDDHACRNERADKQQRHEKAAPKEELRE